MKIADRESKSPVNEDRIGTLYPPGVDPATGAYRGRDVSHDQLRYTLSDVTRAMDVPLAKARQQPNVDRALDIFAQGVVDALKALPPAPPRVAQKSD